MAEGILFNLAGKLLEDLTLLAADELALAWGFKEELNKLTKTASVIREVLRDAEDQRNSNNRQVTLWLKELKDVLYDVEDLLDDVSTDALRRKIVAGNGMAKEVRLFFSKSNQLAYRVKMGHRVKDLRERLDAIAADRANFQLSVRPVEPPLEVRERDQTYSFVHSEEIIGRDDDKKKIVQLLLESESEQNVSIVPIIGIGGLGKTTLAKMIFNDENVGEHFELKMWVCVSERFELKVIVENVIESASGRKPERDLQLETLQNDLRTSINGKKYLLALDDVWNEDPEKWRNLRNLLSGGARGSWIVVTTRSGLVADITGTVPPHILRGLSESESWSLLKRTAFKEETRESNNPLIQAIGMEIIDKCKGVPLALKALGKILYNRTEAEWVRVKNNVRKYLAHEENGILPILKLSYDHLPPHLRKCFAYCSLIPKDTAFPVPELIKVWMALGFIHPLSGDENLEDVGNEYFKDLVWRSFLECQSVDYVGCNDFPITMHDLMHDLACSVAGEEYCIASLDAENVNEKTRYVSFEDELDSSWEIPNTLLKATRVRSFLQLRRRWDLSLSTLSALMSNFKYLRMLDLSWSEFEMLPNSIGKLKHLKALYLYRNYKITTLPSSLSRLQNLKTLDLCWCRNLLSLPSKTSRLVSLKHLQVDGCEKLAYMPRGLGKLTCLQELRMFVVGKTRNKDVGRLSELNGLNKLEGKLRISGLENAVAEQGSTYLKEKLNLKSLWLSWNRSRERDDVFDHVNDETVFECLQPHPNLEELTVDGYLGSKVSSWLSSVLNLTELWLFNCTKCKHLPPLHQLPSLKFIRLSNLDAMENLSETEMQKELFSGKSTTIFFPSLIQLWIHDCPNLKGWWKGDVGESSNPHLLCFPCLSELTVENCPNLTSMPLFPWVTRLRLTNTSSKPLRDTMKLKMTTSDAPWSSPSTLPPFSRLEDLEIQEIEDLDSLPEELLQNLTSLRYLWIGQCVNLTSMPEGMHHLTSLIKLVIIGCPQLSERCQRDTGLDWPNIAHIGNIRIDNWFS